MSNHCKTLPVCSHNSGGFYGKPPALKNLMKCNDNIQTLQLRTLDFVLFLFFLFLFLPNNFAKKDIGRYHSHQFSLEPEGCGIVLHLLHFLMTTTPLVAVYQSTAADQSFKRSFKKQKKKCTNRSLPRNRVSVTG